MEHDGIYNEIKQNGAAAAVLRNLPRAHTDSLKNRRLNEETKK